MGGAIEELDMAKPIGVPHPPNRQHARAAMNRYASGDNSAFPQIYGHLAPTLCRYLMHHTRSVDITADLLQQTLLQLHRVRARFTSDAEVAPWAIAIARRILIDSIRAKRRETRPTDWQAEPVAEPSIEELLHAKRMAHLLEREVARLPDAQRDAIRLTASEEVPLSEAAKLLGTTINAVKLRTHRARLTLKAAIGHKVGGPR
jgi:RNA polymerase sigma-70 factor, ECF subfamily